MSNYITEAVCQRREVGDKWRCAHCLVEWPKGAAWFSTGDRPYGCTEAWAVEQRKRRASLESQQS